MVCPLYQHLSVAAVSDLFSSVLARIQTLMLQRDIEQLSDPNFIPDSSNAV